VGRRVNKVLDKRKKSSSSSSSSSGERLGEVRRQRQRTVQFRLKGRGRIGGGFKTHRFSRSNGGAYAARLCSYLSNYIQIHIKRGNSKNNNALRRRRRKRSRSKYEEQLAPGM